MRTSEHINKFRNREHPQLKSTDDIGMNGCFAIPLGLAVYAVCIVAEGNDQIPWEHVSAHIRMKQNGKWRMRCPTWREMCMLKEIFFKPTEACMQLHPASKDAINIAECVLHLWKPTHQEIPHPPKIAV